MNTTSIIVRFTREGFHFWPEAPEHRAYLRENHRHLFYVEVRCRVMHAGREIEFHDLLDFAEGIFPGGQLGSRSCELMAQSLADQLAIHFERVFTVSVFEDGECGAEATTSLFPSDR